nr:hypothetical protein Iba_chr06bCG8840 [Ipomoea batatas]
METQPQNLLMKPPFLSFRILLSSAGKSMRLYARSKTIGLRGTAWKVGGKTSMRVHIPDQKYPHCEVSSVRHQLKNELERTRHKLQSAFQQNCQIWQPKFEEEERKWAGKQRR